MVRSIKRFLAVMLVLAFSLTIMPVWAAGDANLAVLYVSGAAVIDFDAEQLEYNVAVPYTYVPNDFSVKVPTVTAIPSDKDAEVDIAYPDSVENGVITVTVTAADGVAQKEYRLNLKSVGANLYEDGGFEEGKSKWESVAATLTAVTEGAFAGNYAMQVERPDAFGRYNAKTKPALSANKSYIASNVVKLGPDATEYTTYDSYSGYSESTGSISYFYGDATKRDNSKITITSDWQRTFTLLDTIDSHSVDNYYTKWAGEPTIVVDEYYIGEVVVAEVEIKDDMGSKTIAVERLNEENNEICLQATVYNQFKNNLKMDEVSIAGWELIGEHEGVTIDAETGVLTVTPDAVAPGEVTVAAYAEPSYTGAAQSKAKGIAKVKILEEVDRSGAELSDVTVGGLSIPQFNPKTTSYQVKVPYKYVPNKFTTIDMPEIKAYPKDPEAQVEITPPDSVDGGTAKIKVTSPDGLIEKEYNLSLKLVGKNMYADGGFEQDRTWRGTGAITLTRTTEDKFAGDYSMKVERTDNGYYTSWEKPSFAENKVYIASSVVKTASGVNPYDTYNTFGNFKDEHGIITYWNADGTTGSRILTVNNNWQRTFATVKTVASAPIENYYTRWAADGTILIDEYYIGELVIVDLDYEGDKIITIPSADNAIQSIPIHVTLKNQFGSKIGFSDEIIELELCDDYTGVRTEGKNLIITDRATEGTIRVRAKCTPAWNSEQGTVANSFDFTLVSQENVRNIPQVKEATITGMVVNGETLTADYYYYHANNVDEGASIYKWLYSDTGTSGWTEIKDEFGEICSGTTYTVTEKYAQKYICFEVTPVAEDGTAGAARKSNVLMKPVPPTAENITVTGTRAVGQILTGTYVYSDRNGDAENGTTLQWLIGDSEKGAFTPIDGETGDTYKIRPEDVDKYIIFKVVPKTDTKPQTNTAEFTSKPLLCATTPKVSNVTIKSLNVNTYKVNYNYTHENGIEEGESIIKWYLNDRCVGEGYMLNLSGVLGGKLTVEVTPVAVLAPEKGPVQKAKFTTASGQNAGGGTVVSGGGSSSAPKPVAPKDEDTNTQVPSVKSHWAAEAAEFVKENGIMTDVAENDFGYEKVVTRSEFIYYVIKTAKLPETQYKGGFDDVSADDVYANALQTAVDRGIISEDILFNPNRQVSREEICKILVKTLDLEHEQEYNISKFTDEQSVAVWARGFVAKTVSAGLLLGVSENEFSPKGFVTRAQTAVIMKRIHDFNAKEEENR